MLSSREIKKERGVAESWFWWLEIAKTIARETEDK